MSTGSGSPGGIRAGAAFLEFMMNDKLFKSQMVQMQKSLRTFAKETERVGRAMAKTMAPITAAFGAVTKLAADAEMATRRFGLVFGKQMEDMRDTLQQINQATGVPTSLLTRQTAGFAGLFADLKGTQAYVNILGRVQKETLNLATLTGSFAEAQERMLSGITGSTEVLEKFGVETKVSAMNQIAQQMGIKKTVQQMTELEKKILRLITIEQAFIKQGVEFTELSGSLNLQMSLLWENVKALGAELGMVSAQKLGPIVARFNDWLQSMQGHMAMMPQLVWQVGVLATGYTALGLTLQAVAVAANTAAAGFVKLAAAQKALVTTGAGRAGLMGGAGVLATYFGLELAEKRPEGTMNIPADQHNLKTFWQAFREELWNERTGKALADANAVQSAMDRQEQGLPGPLSVMEAAGEAQAQYEARGTFFNRQIQEQLAFGTQASPLEELKEMMSTILDQLITSGPGGQALKTAPQVQ